MNATQFGSAFDWLRQYGSTHLKVMRAFFVQFTKFQNTRIMKIQKLIYFGLLTILMGSCAAVRVSSDYEKEVDFSTYKTFQLLEHESDFPVGANPINQGRLEKAIRARMIALNYQETDKPDLLITYFVKKEIQQNSHAYRNYYDEFDYVEKYNAYQYKEGTLVINLIDAKKSRLFGMDSLPAQLMKT